jgi:hypothetical protein
LALNLVPNYDFDVIIKRVLLSNALFRHSNSGKWCKMLLIFRCKIFTADLLFFILKFISSIDFKGVISLLVISFIIVIILIIGFKIHIQWYNYRLFEHWIKIKIISKEYLLSSFSQYYS